MAEDNRGLGTWFLTDVINTLLLLESAVCKHLFTRLEQFRIKPNVECVQTVINVRHTSHITCRKAKRINHIALFAPVILLVTINATVGYDEAERLDAYAINYSYTGIIPRPTILVLM